MIIPHTPTNDSSIVREYRPTNTRYPNYSIAQFTFAMEEVARQLLKAKRAAKWESSHKWNRRAS